MLLGLASWSPEVRVKERERERDDINNVVVRDIMSKQTRPWQQRFASTFL